MLRRCDCCVSALVQSLPVSGQRVVYCSTIRNFSPVGAYCLRFMPEAGKAALSLADGVIPIRRSARSEKVAVSSTTATKSQR